MEEVRKANGKKSGRKEVRETRRKGREGMCRGKGGGEKQGRERRGGKKEGQGEKREKGVLERDVRRNKNAMEKK